MTHHDQELTTGERTRMLTAAIVYLLTEVSRTEIMEADTTDLYLACVEAAPQLREARR